MKKAAEKKFKKCPLCGGKLAMELSNGLLKFKVPTCLECFHEPSDSEFQERVQSMGLKNAVKAQKLDNQLGTADSEEEWNEAYHAAENQLKKSMKKLERMQKQMMEEMALMHDVFYEAGRWDQSFQFKMKEKLGFDNADLYNKWG